ncbi:MAG: sugar phosphate nucleotidyltransferase [Chloroflexi bacterium]|nr:sugar phosphate nucleotidyltransferase [Chloroflexota bacterium]
MTWLDSIQMVSANEIAVITKAVIPVAGLGTRFMPVTRSVPKALLPVLNIPLIQYAVDDAVEAGITDIAIVEDTKSVGSYFHSMPDLEERFRQGGRDELADQMVEISSKARITSIKQLEPLGLGHAILLAKNFIADEPFVVILPDEILWGDHSSTAQILDVRDRYGGNVIAVTETSWDDVHTKGIVAGPSVEPNVIAIEEMVEKPKRQDAPSNLAIIGRYALEPSVFDFLSQQRRGAGGEIQLTDAIIECMDDLPTHAVTVDAARYDAGVPEGMFGASLHQAAKDPIMRQMIVDFAAQL